MKYLITIGILCWSLSLSADLISNSPFLAEKGMVKASVGSKSGDYELRGILEIDDITQFSIYSRKEKKAEWVQLKQKGGAYFVDDYDPETKSISLTVNGLQKRISLAESKFEVLPVNKSRGGRSSKPKPSSDKPKAGKGSGDLDIDFESEDSGERKPSKRVMDAFKRYMDEKKSRRGGRRGLR